VYLFTTKQDLFETLLGIIVVKLGTATLREEHWMGVFENMVF
jgi:hypothetical protein